MTIPDLYKLLFWTACLLLMLYTVYKWTIRALLRRKMIRQNGEQAKAKIIQYDTIEVYEEPDKQAFYRCHIAFTTKAGEKVIVKLEEDKPYKFAPGAALTVYYLKSDPHQFYIKEILPFQIRLLPLGIIVVGYSLFNIATIVLRHL